MRIGERGEVIDPFHIAVWRSQQQTAGDHEFSYRPAAPITRHPAYHEFQDSALMRLFFLSTQARCLLFFSIVCDSLKLEPSGLISRRRCKILRCHHYPNRMQRHLRSVRNDIQPVTSCVSSYLYVILRQHRVRFVICVVPAVDLRLSKSLSSNLRTLGQDFLSPLGTVWYKV
jgi:hypothetical protein